VIEVRLEGVVLPALFSYILISLSALVSEPLYPLLLRASASQSHRVLLNADAMSTKSPKTTDPLIAHPGRWTFVVGSQLRIAKVVFRSLSARSRAVRGRCTTRIRPHTLTRSSNYEASG
jgi:hypothetical protein